MPRGRPYLEMGCGKAYEAGYDDGYEDGLRVARRDIGVDMGTYPPSRRSNYAGTIPKARKSNPWVQHLKRFKFRKKRRNESSSNYLVARTKSAKRKYKKKRGKK